MAAASGGNIRQDVPAELQSPENEIVSKKLCFFLRHYNNRAPQQHHKEQLNFLDEGWCDLDELLGQKHMSDDSTKPGNISADNTSTSRRHRKELIIHVIRTSRSTRPPYVRRFEYCEERSLVRATYGHSSVCVLGESKEKGTEPAQPKTLVDQCIATIVKHIKSFSNIGDIQDEALLSRIWAAALRANAITNPVMKSFASEYVIKLDLWQVPALVTKGTLGHIARTCRRLRVLGLRGCPALDDHLLGQLLRRCGALEVLGLSGCDRLSAAGLRRAHAGLRRLRAVYLGCAAAADPAAAWQLAALGGGRGGAAVRALPRHVEGHLARMAGVRDALLARARATRGPGDVAGEEGAAAMGERAGEAGTDTREEGGGEEAGGVTAGTSIAGAVSMEDVDEGRGFVGGDRTEREGRAEYDLPC